MTQLEILIVEDEAQNRAAAEKACPQGYRFSFAEDYETAEKEITSGRYAGAIIDLNLPRKDGEKTGPVGFELVKKANEYAMPYIVFTGGYRHGKREHAKVFLEEDELSMSLESHLTTGAKTDPEAWKQAFEFLKKIGHLQENFAARERYRKHTGRVYRSTK